MPVANTTAFSSILNMVALHAFRISNINVIAHNAAL